MPGEIFATPSLDELPPRLRQRDEQPELAPRSAPQTPNLAGASNTLAEMSGMLSDASNEQLGISPPSVPSRRISAARRPVGILLYLVSIGLVATAVIVLCFGVGFFLLASEAAPVLGETEMPGSAAAAALPVFPPAERPALGEAAPPQASNATRLSAPVSSIGESSAGGVTIIAPPQTGLAPEPATTSSPSAAPTSPRPSAGEIPQLPEGAMRSRTRGRGSDQLGTISRIPHSRSDTTPSAARAGVGRTRSANQDGKVDPEEGAARRENQRQYEQLQGIERAADR
jgi:hypothetical protein